MNRPLKWKGEVTFGNSVLEFPFAEFRRGLRESMGRRLSCRQDVDLTFDIKPASFRAFRVPTWLCEPAKTPTSLKLLHVEIMHDKRIVQGLLRRFKTTPIDQLQSLMPSLEIQNYFPLFVQ